jgi:hypothetical protein
MKKNDINSMLMDSAEIIHSILKNPTKEDIETTKILIASANTLAQTVKTMIQAEVIKLKMTSARGNINQVVHQIANGE